MEVKAWSGGSKNKIYGIRVGFANRRSFFRREWSSIEVEVDGKFHSFPLKAGFWYKSPEFCGPIIREWLIARNAIKWPKRRPPAFELIPLGGAKFTLVG